MKSQLISNGWNPANAKYSQACARIVEVGIQKDSMSLTLIWVPNIQFQFSRVWLVLYELSNQRQTHRSRAIQKNNWVTRSTLNSAHSVTTTCVDCRLKQVRFGSCVGLWAPEARTVPRRPHDTVWKCQAWTQQIIRKVPTPPCGPSSCYKSSTNQSPGSNVHQHMMIANNKKVKIKKKYQLWKRWTKW